MASGLCECGCGEPTRPARQTTRALGHVKGEPVRFIQGHNYRRPGYTVDPSTGCWNWKGFRYPKDGRTGSVYAGNGRLVSAYVWYYEQARGPVAAGLVLDHLCRNAGCVNPDHLEPVSQAVNARRARTTRLTVEQAREIRTLALAGGLSARQIGDRYGISGAHVSGIKHGRKWRETASAHIRRVS